MFSILIRSLLVLILLFVPAAARAQFDSGVVLGVVHDQSGLAVPGATVTLTNLATAQETVTITDGTGAYQIVNVRVGAYRLEAALTGFTTAVAPNVPVTVSARQRVDLTLDVGVTGETVEVTGIAPALETDTSDRGQVVSRDQIVNLPLNGRAYADLALLSPGVRRSTISGSRDGSFNVNGQRSALNNFILDGIDNNSYGTSNQGFSNQVVQVSPDAVEEFRVQTNNFSAEYGRAGGAVVNATFRSGSNRLSGTMWEFHRNTALNAEGYFKPTTGKPTLERNQFGGVLGGPIVRNRAFFFANYEGFRQVQKQVTFSSIPTLEQRQGILGKPVINPLTGELYADGVMPQSAITPFAAKVLAGLPAPTRDGTSNNYDTLPERTDENNKIDIKIDTQLRAGTNAFVRFSHRKQDNFEPPPIPGDISSPANAYVHVLNQQVALGMTHTFSPRSLLELRLGASRTEAGKTAFGTGGPDMLEAYGITGLPTDAVFSGGLTQQSIGGWRAFGRQNSNPQHQDPFAIDVRLNQTWLMGGHSLKAGYEYQAIDTEVDDVNPKYGHDSYSGQFSRPDGAGSDPATYNLADFLVGARSAYSLVNPALFQLRQRMHFAYLQDDWRVGSNLTLNLGARYEFATPQWEADNKLTNFDPSTNSLIQATNGSMANRALVEPDRNNWAPRLGLAYTLNDRTVVRSAYGMSYVHFNRLGGENLLSFNGPNVVAINISQQPSQGPCVDDLTPTGCFRPTQMGYPQGLNVPANFDPINGRVNHIPRDLETGYVQSWHVTLQHELPGDVVVDIGYVGNKSDHLMILGDLNQARPNAPGEDTPLQERRPIDGYQFIQSAFDGGRGDYRALQLKAERRFSDGVYVLNSFTWSRARDNASGHLETANGDNSRVNMANLGDEFGISSYNEPFNNTTTLVWEVPFGHGRSWGGEATPIVNAMLGGWRITAINTMTSGRPVNLTYSPASNASVSGAPTYRPNIVGDIYLPDGERGPDGYLNPAGVEIPTDRSQPFGNAPRNAARGPAIATLDLGFHKSVPIGRGFIEFRAEIFNVLNRANFNPPNGNRSSSAFGTITSQATTPRQGQIGVKIGF